MDLSKLKPVHQETIETMLSMKKQGVPVSDEAIQEVYDKCLALADVVE